MTTWEGLDLAPAHRRWRFWVAQGRDELPDVRVSSQLIPFRRGRLHQAGLADRRLLELRGYIQEDTLAALRAQADTLKGLLDPERATAGLLVDDFEDGGQRWIRAIPRDIIPRYGGEATRLMSIELESLDPFWYASVGTLTLDAGLFLNDGYALDSSAETIVDAAGSDFEIELDNPGTAVTERLAVRMTGASSSGVGVENVTSGVGFTSTAVLAAGDEVLVDALGRSMTRNGISIRGLATIRPGGIHGEYLSLLPGPNRIRIYGRPTQTRLQFFPAYL